MRESLLKQQANSIEQHMQAVRPPDLLRNWTFYARNCWVIKRSRMLLSNYSHMAKRWTHISAIRVFPGDGDAIPWRAGRPGARRLAVPTSVPLHVPNINLDSVVLARLRKDLRPNCARQPPQSWYHPPYPTRPPEGSTLAGSRMPLVEGGPPDDPLSRQGPDAGVECHVINFPWLLGWGGKLEENWGGIGGPSDRIRQTGANWGKRCQYSCN